MNARDLIELLEELDPQTEIRIATQPAWPFEYSLTGDMADNCEIDPEGEAPVVWLGIGEQLGYLAEPVAGQLGWG